MDPSEYTKREKTREIRFNQKTFVCMESMINNFERLSRNLTGNKKKAEMSDKEV